MLSFLNGFYRAQDSKQKGVTLVEMAVVIGIVFLLASLMIVEYNNMDDKARRNSTLVSAKALGNAMDIYRQDNGKYTCILNDLNAYTNVTSLRTSFLTVTVSTDDCTFASFTYVRISGFVKNVVPNYIVNYYVTPEQDPKCSADGSTPYPCKDKW